jgi:retron-type reverse transcriptase
MSTPKEMRAGVPQGSVLSPTLCNVYINNTSQTLGVHLAFFADDTCLYATDRKRVLLSENTSAVSPQWRPGVSAEY